MPPQIPDIDETRDARIEGTVGFHPPVGRFEEIRLEFGRQREVRPRICAVEPAQFGIIGPGREPSLDLGNGSQGGFGGVQRNAPMVRLDGHDETGPHRPRTAHH
jgi:hypothetical protein